MLLPVLGVFRAGDSSGMVFCLNYEYASGGYHYMVYLGGLAVCGREQEIVEDYIVFPFQAPQLLGDYFLAASAAAGGFAPPPRYDNPYRQGCQQDAA